MSRETANEMLWEIGNERREQIRRWGAHDRDHPLGVWATILCEQVGRLAGAMIRDEEGKKGSPWVYDSLTYAPSSLLFRLVGRAGEVAAVAIAIGEYAIGEYAIEQLQERGDWVSERDDDGKVYDDGQ